MNWGDDIASHQYVSVFWCQLENALKKVYLNLLEGRGPLSDSGVEESVLQTPNHEVR
jgi:hypothetical protein